MWNFSRSKNSSRTGHDDQAPSPASSPVGEVRLPIESSRTTQTTVRENEAIVCAGLVVKGEVCGSGSLLIEGSVEGTVNLPGSCVTIGRKGLVKADISAKEVVVMGTVNGNLKATDRVKISNEGSLTGDVAAPRVSIEDGAFFKGAIDISGPDQGLEFHTQCEAGLR
jgi:cytoskeletal protein CcmA (bactofilin family)